MLGAFRGSPSKALELEASILPYSLRLFKQNLNYSTRALQFQRDHPITQAYQATCKDELNSGTDLGVITLI